MQTKLPPGCYSIYVCMQKRADGKIYPDMHKTNGSFFYSEADAQKELDSYPDWLRLHYHVVAMVVAVEKDWNSYFSEVS